jgi:very-short-patch-repair endonuclease
MARVAIRVFVRGDPMTTKIETSSLDARGDVLVAILPTKADFEILPQQGWYRIPADKAPKSWPPRWLAFYQPQVFGPEAFAVNYYGRVRDIRLVKRRELFPEIPHHPKADREYYQVRLDGLQRLPRSIPSARLRRIVFIPTTWPKFLRAEEINDLYDESPLEDDLWAELKALQIRAERQWMEQVETSYYLLDFAVFCERGRLDIETDGDSWHAQPDRIPLDNRRNNHLTSTGWEVLRFNGQQIREGMSSDCIPLVVKTISRLGGASDEGVIPRGLRYSADGVAQQLALCEGGPEYELD